MSERKGDFEHESVQDRESIVKYLTALTDGIRNGRLLFHNKESELVLEPEGLMNLAVKAKRSSSKTKLKLTLTWKENNVDRERGDLVIDPAE